MAVVPPGVNTVVSERLSSELPALRDPKGQDFQLPTLAWGRAVREERMFWGVQPAPGQTRGPRAQPRMAPMRDLAS